jgi:glycosyltransferase involved in cell wall biosynthesis
MSTSDESLTVLIPTYEMSGIGADRLRIGLRSIEQQSLRPDSVVVIDSSSDDAIKKLCREYSAALNINYQSAPHLKYGQKLNAGIDASETALIKLLNQDDYLAHAQSLAMTRELLSKSSAFWCAEPTIHTKDDINFYREFYPRMNPNIQRRNTISAPSVVAVRRHSSVRFDHRFHSRIDIDFYARLRKQHGEPVFGDKVSTIQFIGPHQVSRRLTKKHLIEDSIRTRIKEVRGEYAYSAPSASTNGG